MDTNKVCKTCRTEKPISEFYKTTNRIRRGSGKIYIWNGFHHRCKDCSRTHSLNTFHRNKNNYVRQKQIILNSAKVRAKKKNLPFSITINDFEIPEYCPVFKVKLSRGVGKRNDNSPALDRKVPSLGYVPGNIFVISDRANRIKNDASINDLQMLMEYLKTP